MSSIQRTCAAAMRWLFFLSLLLAVIALVAYGQEEPRPRTPSDETLAAPTSQIAAWYRYAVSLESALEMLRIERDKAIAVADALTGVKELRERVAALERQVVPAEDYAKLNERLQAALQHNMYLAGQLNKAAGQR